MDDLLLFLVLGATVAAVSNGKGSSASIMFSCSSLKYQRFSEKMFCMDQNRSILLVVVRLFSNCAGKLLLVRGKYTRYLLVLNQIKTTLV